MSVPNCSPYEFLAEISTERENKIYKVQSKTAKKYALKTFQTLSDKTKEAEMLMKCSSPCVIELVDDIEAGLVLELMETDAYAYFRLIQQSMPNLLSLKIKELLLQTVIPGLDFLHKNQICHGDLKCGNILARQSFPGCLVWKISDFDHATYFDDPIDPGTYLSPEMVLRTRQGKKLPASHTIDVFALGMMIVDIFSGFTYYQEQSSSDLFCDMAVELELPASIPNSFAEKLASMIAKDRTKRITVSKFAESQLFRDLSTTQKTQIGMENMTQRFDVLTMQITQDSHKLNKISNQLEDVSEKLDEINQKLDQFLPAIQQNILDIMATEAVPGKFVMLPVKSSFIRKALSTFYTKYDIWFFCEDESGAHLVKHDHSDEKKKKGFEFFEVTAFGEAAMFVCKCLLMLAIKQLTGMSFFVAGAQVDLTQLRSSLTAVNTEILAYDVETLSKFKMDTESDWDAISRQVMPALKSFLATKDRSLMGVKPSNNGAGRLKFLCDFHYKSTSVAPVVNPPTYNSSNRQNEGILASVPASVVPESIHQATPEYATHPRTTPVESVKSSQTQEPIVSEAAPSYATQPIVSLANKTHSDNAFSNATQPRAIPEKANDYYPAMPGFSNLTNIAVPETEAPKTHYYNPYLNQESIDSSAIDSKLPFNTPMNFSNIPPPLQRGATVSVIEQKPYDNPYCSPVSNVFGRSSTVRGFDVHAGHQKVDSSGSLGRNSNASSGAGFPAIPYPAGNNYGNYQPSNPPLANMGYPAVSALDPQYLTQQSPPAYNSGIPYQNSGQTYAPPTQPYYTAPVTLGTSLSDHNSDRSTSPVPFNPLLPMTLQRNFQQRK